MDEYPVGPSDQIPPPSPPGYAPRWKRHTWIIVLVLFFVGWLVLQDFLLEINKSGHGIFYVSSAEELDAVPWHENNVCINDPNLTDEQLSAFLQSNSIESLTLNGCERITSKGLIGLEHSRQLLGLSVTGIPVDDTLSVTLAKLHQLERLTVGYTQVHELSDEVFSRNPNLRSLDISDCRVTRRLLQRCAAHGSLTSLDLSGCTGATWIFPRWESRVHWSISTWAEPL